MLAGMRVLKAEEIECRVGTINEKGLSLLLFKDARVDQKLLDETFSPMGWKRVHHEIGGNLYCTVSVWDEEKKQWIDKQDVGTMGREEKEKSQASDSFKRACFNWGIGRELYTAPFIWVPAEHADIQKRGERYSCNENFSVASITYNSSREITGLVIVNGKGKRVFEMKAENTDARATEKDSISKTQMDSLNAELERTGVSMKTVQDRYKIKVPEEMPQELYNKVMAALSKTKPTNAA